MKEITLFLCLAFGLMLNSSASSYHLNESAIDRSFSESQDVSHLLALDISSHGPLPDGTVTKGGYLVRAFFCGWTGMHRKYIGTGGEKLGWYYCLSTCLGMFTVVGSVPVIVDFWGVIFSESLWEKYQDNPKFLPWLE
ncbi:MAG: hypothetical protein R2813_14070 [Flavobacteriales bacterium]